MLGPNINVPMDPKQCAGRCRLQKAQALAAGASEKEQELIEAVATRYSEDPAAERPQLDAAFADAMTALSDKYPDDLELAVMASEAGNGHPALGLLAAGRQGTQRPAADIVNASKAFWPKIPITRGRSTSTSTSWKPPTAPNVPSPMPIGSPR